MPTKQELLTHARKYGTDGVLETAIEAGCGVEYLALLITDIDKIEEEHARKSRRFFSPKRHRLTPEQRAKRLLGIEDDAE